MRTETEFLERSNGGGYSGCEIQYIALPLVSPFTEAANVLLLDDVCRIHDSDMLPTISPQSASCFKEPKHLSEKSPTDGPVIVGSFTFPAYDDRLLLFRPGVV